jgi:hypothetical protein
MWSDLLLTVDDEAQVPHTTVHRHRFAVYGHGQSVGRGSLPAVIEEPQGIRLGRHTRNPSRWITCTAHATASSERITVSFTTVLRLAPRYRRRSRPGPCPGVSGTEGQCRRP